MGSKNCFSLLSHTRISAYIFFLKKKGRGGRVYVLRNRMGDEPGGLRWEYMGYYCNECKKTLSVEEFFHWKNQSTRY